MSGRIAVNPNKGAFLIIWESSPSWQCTPILRSLTDIIPADREVSLDHLVLVGGGQRARSCLVRPAQGARLGILEQPLTWRGPFLAKASSRVRWIASPQGLHLYKPKGTKCHMSASSLDEGRYDRPDHGHNHDHHYCNGFLVVRGVR